MSVPFLDLKSQYAAIKDEIRAAILEVVESCCFAGGPYVKKFETEFASYCRCREAVGVGNGTEALWLALTALGIGPGHEVITVPNTFIATAEAISFCGATPVFVDIEEKTYNMNPELLKRAVTRKTRAILPVHLFGQMADMEPILKIARDHHLYVIEDACQAHGAEYDGKKAGSVGDVGCFSFYPGKNLGAYGEAGALVTQDSRLAEKLRMLRDHGQRKKYDHADIGWNARMDGIQGAVLSVKLKYLDQWNYSRREHAQMYKSLLADIPELILPWEEPNRKHIYHVFAVRHPDRDRLLADMAGRGITCAIHYPLPIHLQDAYLGMEIKKGDFPLAEKTASEFLSLPMYPELTGEQIEAVCNSLKTCCRRSTAN